LLKTKYKEEQMNQHLKSLLDENRLTPSFELGGKQFYSFTDDGVNMSQQRFEAFQDMLATYNTFNVKKEDIDLFNTLVEDYSTSIIKNLKNEDVVLDAAENIKMLSREMKQRIEYNLPIDRTYALASFLYVQDDENPLQYDEKLNKEKIQLFKTDKSLFDFFLSQQLPIFLDLQRVYQPSFQTIMKGVNQQKITQLLIYLQSQYTDGKNKDMLSSSIVSQVEDLMLYNNLIENLSQITTDSLNKS